MTSGNNVWKKGRGKLGLFAPLLGTWTAEGDSPRGTGRYTRVFSRILNGTYIELKARWEYPDYIYDELALFGVNRDGTLAFWSFTSDGKQSHGLLADASDLHPDAIAFEADMPAGRARQVYWPAESGGVHWIVESKTQRGWSRLVQHEYRRV